MIRRSVDKDSVHWVYLLQAKRIPTETSNRKSQLLYVGMTSDIGKRLTQHFKDKEWSVLIGEVSLLCYPNRDLAAEAERDLIVSENPLFNVANAPMGTDGYYSKFGQEQVKEQNKFLAQFDQWVPSVDYEDRLKVSQNWRRAKALSGLGLDGLDKRIEDAFYAAALSGVGFDSVEATIEEAFSRAKGVADDCRNQSGKPVKLVGGME